MQNTSKRLSLLTFVLTFAIACPAFSDKIIYVDATGVNNGPSRTGFQSGVQYPSIQAAIDAAVDGDTIILTPGAFRGDGNRDIDFKGKAITLRGTDPNDPNIVAATIIDCNGTEDEPHRAFYFRSGEGANSILAGVTIMNGYAEDGGGVYCESSSPTLRKCNFTRNLAQAFEDCSGGGMYNYRSSPTLLDCTFSGNSAFALFHGGGSGGGIHNRDSSPTLTNCTFENNSTAWAGGGMRNSHYSTPTLSNCTFGGNSANDCGGGMNNDYHSNPTLTNCTFSGNSATRGGGIHNDRVSPVLTNCSFSGNSASYGGGGMDNYNDEHYQCSPTLINCTFANNRANMEGGGISNSRSNPTLTNCTLSGNSADHGAGMYNYFGSKPILTNCLFIGNTANNLGGGMSNIHNSGLELNNCTFALNSATNGNALACYHRHQQHLPSDVQMTNCILWDHGSEIWNNDDSSIAISYSDVQSGWPGEGNIDADPCFVDPGYWDANGTPEDVNDDFWVDGDYHLKSEASRYDPTTQTWVTDDVTSPCIDAGDPMFPIGDEPFPNGGIVNMGIYGGTEEASKSYFGKPPCETIVAGDVNGDCVIDFKDFQIMALHWMEDNDIPVD